MRNSKVGRLQIHLLAAGEHLFSRGVNHGKLVSKAVFTTPSPGQHSHLLPSERQEDNCMSRKDMRFFYARICTISVRQTSVIVQHPPLWAYTPG